MQLQRLQMLHLQIRKSKMSSHPITIFQVWMLKHLPYLNKVVRAISILLISLVRFADQVKVNSNYNILFIWMSKSKRKIPKFFFFFWFFRKLPVWALYYTHQGWLYQWAILLTSQCRRSLLGSQWVFFLWIIFEVIIKNRYFG